MVRDPVAMIQVSYVSRTREPMTAEQLLALLHECRTNNRARHVTGMLLYANGTFLQALEGEERVIDALLEEIWRDSRHADLQLLHRKPIARRQYADWSMGFERVTDEGLLEIEGLRDFGARDFEFDYLVRHEPVVEKLMEHFRAPHWNPLLGELDAKDRTIQELERGLAQARGRIEDASLVLESVLEANRKGPLSDALVRLCESTLDSLRPRGGA